MRRKELPSAEEICAGKRRIAVLENVMNPTNIGAIFRSAAALNMDLLVSDPEIKVEYNKGGCKPSSEIILKYNGITLKSGKDYTLKFTNTTKVADANGNYAKDKDRPKVVITGTGNYSGKFFVYYTIMPVDIEEAAKLGETGVPEYHEVLAKVTKRALAELLGEKVEEEEEEEELDAIIMEEVDEFGNAVEEGKSTLDNYIEDDVEDGFED